jgi:hypothetical protein
VWGALQLADRGGLAVLVALAQTSDVVLRDLKVASMRCLASLSTSDDLKPRLASSGLLPLLVTAGAPPFGARPKAASTSAGSQCAASAIHQGQALMHSHCQSWMCTNCLCKRERRMDMQRIRAGSPRRMQSCSGRLRRPWLIYAVLSALPRRSCATMAWLRSSSWLPPLTARFRYASRHWQTSGGAAMTISAALAAATGTLL